MAGTERNIGTLTLQKVKTEYRRYLPHIQPAGQTFFVTWILAGCRPVCRRAVGWNSDGAIFAQQDQKLDRAEAGPLWLADRRVGSVVMDVLLAGVERGGYRLGAWVIMPDHVHISITPEKPLWVVMREIKSGSARLANRILKREGPFWYVEYYDRLVRNSIEAARVTNYIHRNPVRAGLCSNPEF